MEVLTHIGKRIRSNKDIRLPLAQLVQQYSAPDVSNLIQNVNIVYLGICSSLSVVVVVVVVKR